MLNPKIMFSVFGLGFIQSSMHLTLSSSFCKRKFKSLQTETKHASHYYNIVDNNIMIYVFNHQLF